jgi:hypothetical protein
MDMSCILMRNIRHSGLTRRRNPPKAIQNTKGPARSESSNISFSGVLNGFRTESV